MAPALTRSVCPGLAAENLDISILSGSVVHENLHLKKTAFDALALPVVGKSGTWRVHPPASHSHGG